MGDSELEAIRARRMAELQQQGGGERAQQQAEQQAKQQEMKNMMLSQLLDQGARARLNTIAKVKPDKAQMVEGLIIRMAQSGQLPDGVKLNEERLIGLLEQVSSSTQKKTNVKFDRRRVNLDSDDSD